MEDASFQQLRSAASRDSSVTGSAALTVAAVGDIMLGDSPAVFGAGAGTALHRMGLDRAVARLRRVLPPADLIVGNLEAPLGTDPWPIRDYHRHQFLGHPLGAELLQRAGFGAVSIANNHIMQHGLAAFQRTCARLRESGIGVAGLTENGRPVPYVHEVHGKAVTVFGFSLRPEVNSGGPAPYAQTSDPDWIVESLRGYRLVTGWKRCIVCLHWGYEYLTSPHPGQVALARRLFDEGVSAILGHHPHVLQPVRIANQRLVAFSLGNFVFDMWRRIARRSVVLAFGMDGSGGCCNHQALPVLLGRDGWPNRAPAGDARAIVRLLGLTGHSASSDASSESLAYERAAARAEFWNALHNRVHFVTHFLDFPASARRQAIAHFVTRRLRKRS